MIKLFKQDIIKSLLLKAGLYIHDPRKVGVVVEDFLDHATLEEKEILQSCTSEERNKILNSKN